MKVKTKLVPIKSQRSWYSIGAIFRLKRSSTGRIRVHLKIGSIKPRSHLVSISKAMIDGGHSLA